MHVRKKGKTLVGLNIFHVVHHGGAGRNKQQPVLVGRKINKQTNNNNKMHLVGKLMTDLSSPLCLSFHPHLRNIHLAKAAF